MMPWWFWFLVGLMPVIFVALAAFVQWHKKHDRH